MIQQSLYEDLKSLLALQLNQTVTALHLQPVSGGSINQTYKITLSNTHTFFCKINSLVAYPQLFLKEKNGLSLLAQAKVINVPKTVLYAVSGNYQILLLEWIETGVKTQKFWAGFGEQLAALHHVQHTQFGLQEDNYMGSVLQQNTWENNWIDFFAQHRLKPLVAQCHQQQLLSVNDLKQFEKLYSRLPLFFPDSEKPCLLHGDLWSGNYMCNPLSQPVLIDPAVYYGHRSVDLGMTTLFGGFDTAFYEAYQYHYPLPAHYKEQWDICNIYPLLIHLLLFGKSYLGRVQQSLHQYATK